MVTDSSLIVFWILILVLPTTTFFIKKIEKKFEILLKGNYIGKSEIVLSSHFYLKWALCYTVIAITTIAAEIHALSFFIEFKVKWCCFFNVSCS